MKVICISKEIVKVDKDGILGDFIYKELSIGKVYDANMRYIPFDETSKFYLIYVDLIPTYFPTSLFITLEQSREDQLNKILT